MVIEPGFIADKFRISSKVGADDGVPVWSDVGMGERFSHSRKIGSVEEQATSLSCRFLSERCGIPAKQGKKGNARGSAPRDPEKITSCGGH
jgi:hypothetical protein